METIIYSNDWYAGDIMRFADALYEWNIKHRYLIYFSYISIFAVTQFSPEQLVLKLVFLIIG